MNLSEINKAISAINGNQSKPCVFLGAGADVSSGGLLFNALKDRTIDKFTDFSSNALDKDDKEKMFDKLVSENSNYHFCENLTNDINAENEHKVSDGYKILLLMAQYGFIDMIVSTNFFNYLESAQKEFNIGIKSKYINGYINEIPSNIANGCSYLKIHGDAESYMITHITEDEINNKEYMSQTKEMLISAIKNHSIIFIGYSGNDKKITEIIAENIEQINQTYFINISESNSPLINLLKSNNKYFFCNADFDAFMTHWGFSRLSGIKIDDSYPLLIESLLDARTDSSINTIRNDTTIYIERKSIEEKLSYLNHTVFIQGKAGVGKTVLIGRYIRKQKRRKILYVDLSTFPKQNAVSVITATLGFKSEVPIALLHRLCSWYKNMEKYITFIIDGIDKCDGYIEELLLLAKLNENNDYVTFIFSSRQKNLGAVCGIVSTEENTINLDCFTDDEVTSIINLYKLKSNCNDKFQLMHEPFICSIICDYYSKTQNENHMVFDIIEEYIEKKANINADIIHSCLISIATKSEASPIPQNCINKLREIGLICGNRELKYDSLNQYYLYCHMVRDYVERAKSIERLKSLLKNNYAIEPNEYAAFHYIYTSVAEVSEIQDSIIAMNDLVIGLNDSTAMSCVKFIRECLKTIIQLNEDKFASAIKGISLSNLCDKMIFLLIITANLIKNKKLSLEIWRKLYEKSEFKYVVFIYYIDTVYEEMFNCSTKEDVRLIYEKRIDFFKDKVTVPLYILMKLDISAANSECIREVIMEQITRLMISDKYKCQQEILDTLKKYAYNILFNSDGNFDENYNSIINNEKILCIIKDVINGGVLNSKQLTFLVRETDIINNMILFLLCNLIVVLSLANDKSKTLDAINQIIEGNHDFSPEQIDFILSCTFMSLYQDDPFNRKDFTDVFDKICEKYETQLFEQPSQNRTSTFNRFTNQFDIIFEDGFNPTAFLFYTAPLAKEKNALEQYVQFRSVLAKSGNYGKMLKLIHATGQMISVYPNEGMSELGNYLKYNESIVLQGIIRVLTETLQRFPYETEDFITKNNVKLSKQDELHLYGSPVNFINRRTLEQLHWSRLIYWISKSDRTLIKRILHCFTIERNFSQFIAQVLEIKTF